VADDHATKGGREHNSGAELPRSEGDRPAKQFRVLRVLQDESALKVTGAVQAGTQSEVPFEERAGPPEQVEELVACRHGPASIQFELNRTAPPDVYSQITAHFLLMELCSMRHVIRHVIWTFALLAPLGQASAWAQNAPQGATGVVRRLSVDDAVRLALEQNLGIQIDRLNPQIQDVSVAQARTGWIPNLTSSLTNNSQNQPPTSALSGGQNKIVDSQFATAIGVAQTLKTGANYAFSWNSSRQSTTNLFTSFDPLLSSNVAFNITQPLLQNFKIDNLRATLETSRKDREAADIQLESTIVSTTRNVKNAYWDLAYNMDNLKAQQQSLDLAKRLLADNEKRVQIGTMAPIDIVEAQSEVARNEESVIVAEAAIKQAEDRLRALIFDPKMPDFWTVGLEPSDSMPFTAQTVDVDAAVRKAIADRTDIQVSKNLLARNDINIRLFRNQILPQVNATASYRSNAVGGVFLSPVSLTSLGAPRSVVAEQGFGSVLGDIFTNTFPTWQVGFTLSYPLGTSTQETNLARAKLQYQQEETQLKNLELQVATQVRDAGRQVQTNQKRVDSARAARELAERRLEAEEKKFAAGIQISFFVFQAQRDLAQARTSEIRAIADYNKSLVDFEAVQATPLR
jgi:outer membrane protein TolC